MPHVQSPSQDSCCSNDTLFNLEELANTVPESEFPKDAKEDDAAAGAAHCDSRNEKSDKELREITREFLEHERRCEDEPKSDKEVQSVSESKAVIPDLLQDMPGNSDALSEELDDEIAIQNSKNLELNCSSSAHDRSAELILGESEDVQVEPFYSNCVPDHADYVNINGDKCVEPEYINSVAVNMDDLDLYDKVDNTESSDSATLYGALADIRFTGPSDCQLMSTSFSESVDLGEEQDWDSGSDTRSSSSGEFIWKVCQYL